MKNEEVFIIGGGASLAGFDFNKLKNKNTIAVNKSYSYVPNLDYFVTMDYTYLNKTKEKLNKVKTSKIFVAAMDNDYIMYEKGQIIDKRWNLVYHLKDINMLIFSKKGEGMGLSFDDFRHGCSSGFCAVQFAILMGYKKIYLLGMDLLANQKTHFHGGYGESKEKFKRKLDFYYEYFQKGLKELKEKNLDIKIFSCSLLSRLNGLLEYKEI